MKWKHVPPALLILIPYLVSAPIVLSMLNIPIFPEITVELIQICFILFYSILLIINAVCAFFLPWDTDELVHWNLRIKYLLIPFYLFVMLEPYSTLTLKIYLVATSIIQICLSSCYGFRALVQARQENVIARSTFWLLLPCHAFFVTDLVGAVILHRKLKG